MNEYVKIRLLAREVEPNRSANGQLCPFCNGGKHAERSLSITTRHDGIALFLCHRASCGRSGRVHLNGSVSASQVDTPVQEFKPRIWNGESRQLNNDERLRLEHDFGFTYREINWHRLAIVSGGDFADRCIVRVIGPSQQLRGHTLRTFPGRTDTPKTLTYKELDEPFAGWFWTESSTPNKVVLVEDCFSAMKVARQYVAVALLGTNLSMENVFEIMKHTDNVVLALDKDATDKALKYQQKYRFIAPNMQVAVLDKDLRFESDLEIKRRVEGEVTSV